MNINDFKRNNSALNVKQYKILTEGVIYFICEKSGEIIYIGSTMNLQSRLKNHSTRIEFHDKPVFFLYLPKNECLRVEVELIQELNPKYNIQWVNGEYVPFGYKNIKGIKKNNRIGKKIIAFLEKENMSQNNLAKRMGISRQRIGQIIHNKRQQKLQLRTIKKIALAIDLSLEDLLGKKSQANICEN